VKVKNRRGREAFNLDLRRSYLRLCVISRRSRAPANAAGTGARIALLNLVTRVETESVVRRIDKIETRDRARLPAPFRRRNGVSQQGGRLLEPGLADRSRRARSRAEGAANEGALLHGAALASAHAYWLAMILIGAPSSVSGSETTAPTPLAAVSLALCLGVAGTPRARTSRNSGATAAN
jgi:hypothetical protein